MNLFFKLPISDQGITILASSMVSNSFLHFSFYRDDIHDFYVLNVLQLIVCRGGLFLGWVFLINLFIY